MSVLPLDAGRTAFGAQPEHYETARPPYPPALYASLFARCPVDGARVFEIGPGTGAATLKILAQRPSALAAIEPDPRLAAYLSKRVGRAHPELHLINAPWEDAELARDSYDLGVAATSFHWLTQATALAKVWQTLKPGGRWAMWWNVFGDPDTPDDFELRARPHFAKLPKPRSWPDTRRKPFALDEAARLQDLRQAGFEHVTAECVRWTTRLDTGQVTALAATFSQVATAPPDTQRAFLSALAELVERDFGGSVERRLLTPLYTGRKPFR